MSESIIKINNTSYSVTDDWLKIAGNFFNLDQNSENGINLLKAGLFGYNNEIQSNEVKNATFHRNILYDEHFLNTASFPESIYNFAKLYNYPVESATPSHMRINLSLKKEDLVNNKFKKEVNYDMGSTTKKRKVYELILNNEYVFMLEKFKFMLPYPVQFLLKETELGDFAITAKYKNDPDVASFPFLDITSNPYLKMWSDNVDGVDYVYVALDIFQVNRKVTEYTIISEDVSENLYFDIKHEEQIAFFNVYYNYKGKRRLLNTYFNNTYVPKNEEYCYYTFVNDDTLQISFSALPNSFRPRFNSTLEVEVFTTSGNKGNFTYNGSIKVNFNNGNEFNKIPINIVPITDSSGGRNKPDFTEIKNKIIQELLGRRNIITNIDLEVYFNNFNNNTSINGSRVSFIKKRHDVIKRQFNGYLLLRDKERKVVPTMTAPSLYIDKEYLENPFNIVSIDDSGRKEVLDSRGLILDNTDIIYNRPNNIFSLWSNGVISMADRERYNIGLTPEYEDIWLNSENNQVGYFYTVNTKKINRVYTVKGKNLVYKDYEVNIKNEPVSVYTQETEVLNNMANITLDKDKVFKLSIDSKNKLSVSNNEGKLLYSEFNGKTFKITLDALNENNDYIRYKLPYVIKMHDDPYKANYYKTNINESYPLKIDIINSQIDRPFLINSLRIQKDNTVQRAYKLYLTLNTNLSIDELDDCIKIRAIIESEDGKNGFIEFKRISKECEYEATIQTANDIIIDNEMKKIKLYNSLYKTNGDTSDIYKYFFVSEKANIKITVLYKNENSNEKYGDFAKMKDINEYACTSIFSTYDKIEFFKELSLFMDSDIIPQYDKEDEEKKNPLYFKVKQVPLIESDYFAKRNEELYEVLSKYNDLVSTIVDKIENNDSIDIKLYNTSGPSYWYVTDTNGKPFLPENFDYVDNTNIPLELTIFVNKIITDQEDEMIKSYISDFVEFSNETGLLALSNLMRELENNFDFIRYIEHGTICDENTQKVFNKFTSFLDMTREEIVDYVPEYLNIRKKLEEVYFKNSDGSKIHVGYDYKYDIKITYK